MNLKEAVIFLFTNKSLVLSGYDFELDNTHTKFRVVEYDPSYMWNLQPNKELIITSFKAAKYFGLTKYLPNNYK